MFSTDWKLRKSRNKLYKCNIEHHLMVCTRFDVVSLSFILEEEVGFWMTLCFFFSIPTTTTAIILHDLVFSFLNCTINPKFCDGTNYSFHLRFLSSSSSSLSSSSSPSIVIFKTAKYCDDDNRNNLIKYMLLLILIPLLLFLILLPQILLAYNESQFMPAKRWRRKYKRVAKTEITTIKHLF